LFYLKRNAYNKQKHKSLYVINILLWIFILPLKLLELFGFSHLLNVVFQLFTTNRKLNQYEITELKKVIGDDFNFSKVRINEISKLAKLGAKYEGKVGLGFVFLRTVNFSRIIDTKSNSNDMAWLVHEVFHVVQFNELGMQYMFEALIAQRLGGYDFGGIENAKNHSLNYFNLEQQADIIKTNYLNVKTNK
jgi:hypothetical protein